MLQRFKVIKPHTGHSDNWGSPKKIELKEGDILTRIDEFSNERGDLFFSINGNVNNKVKPSSFKTKHPYDKGVIDSEYLELVTE